MDSEVKKKEGKGADLGMIVSGSKEGNVIMGSVGGKQVSNEERREPERKKGKGADRMDSWFKGQETIMAVTWITIVALIELLKILALSCRKRNERVRPDEERWDCFSCRAHLKFESSIGNIVCLARCKNQTAEEDVEQLCWKSPKSNIAS